MARRTLLTAAVCACALALGATALAATRFETHLRFTEAESTPNPEVLIFKGKVRSQKAACERGRTVKFATKPAGSDGPYTPQGSDVSNSTGAFSEDVNVAGLPDVRISTARKTIGPEGDRKVCSPDAILVTAN